MQRASELEAEIQGGSQRSSLSDLDDDGGVSN